MKNLVSDIRIWLIIVCLILTAFLLQQCNKNSTEKIKREQAEQIANQNMKAMNDSSIQLKMTRKQLAESDSVLSATVQVVDKLMKDLGNKKDKIREVIRVKPVIVYKNSDVKNTARQDLEDSSKYHLDFNVNDSVKSFAGVSSFIFKKTDSTISIVGDTTKIRDFKLNFDMVIVKYDDPVAKVTKYKIIPFYIDDAGGMHALSENQIKFNYRGVELLDKPWQENSSTIPGLKKKVRLVGMWGIGFNPIGVGPVIKNRELKIGYSPSISFGYFLTFQKR